MAETETDDRWSTEREAPPPKRGVPRWLWGCGIGCGLFAVLGLVVLLLFARSAMRMVDPELQWPLLGEVVAIAERPAGWRIQGSPSFMKLVPGFEGAWILESDDHTRYAMILAFEAAARGDFDALFTGEVPASMPWGMGTYAPEPGVLEVQGRSLRVLRFRTQRPEGEPEADPAGGAEEPSWFERVLAEAGEGAQLARAGANVDVTTDPAEGPLVLLQYSTPGKLERIPDEELVAFLAHFDLGPR
jgi:hypothetical protein